MDFKEKITIASSFSILVAACYMFGYWGAFNINIMELGSFIDLTKLAIFPLLTTLLFLSAGSFITDMLTGDILPSGGGNNTLIGQFGFKYWKFIAATQMVLIVIVAISGREPFKWFAISFLIAPLSVLITHSKTIIEYIPNAKLRNITLNLVVTLPFLSFAYGRLDAYVIMHNHANRIVDVVRSKLELKQTAEKKVAYLGRIGDTDIMYETLTRTVVFTKQVDDRPLFFIPHYENSLNQE